MPRNGSGTMSVPNTFTPNTVIASAEVNANFVDFATEITNSVARDGQGGMLAELPLDATGWSYNADPDTGMRRTAANTQAIEVGGSDVVTITTASVTFSVPITATFLTVSGITLTGSLSVTGSSVGFTPLQGISTEAGAAAGPISELYRDSATPAADDFIGATDFYGKDSVAAKTLYARLVAQIKDTTNGSEDANLILQTIVAGALTEILRTDGANVAIAAALNVVGAITAGATFSGTNITGTGAITGATAAGAMIASAAEEEAGNAADKLTTPSVQHRHASAGKAWGNLDGTGVITLRVNYNVSSVDDVGVGDYRYNIGTDYSSADWVATLASQRPNTNDDGEPHIRAATVESPAAGSIRVLNTDLSLTPIDAEIFNMDGFGDQA